MKDIGLVLVQNTPHRAHDPLISGVEHGLEEILVKSGMRLTTRVVPDGESELDVYRYWHATDAVDAVVLMRLTRDDKNVSFLHEVKMPFVAIVDETQVGQFSAVAIDNTAMMRALVEHLTSRGRSNIVYVSGPAEVEPSSVRAAAFLQESARAGFQAAVISCEPSAEGAQRATRQLLAADLGRPTAVIYDDDVTAAAGQRTIQAAGAKVPDDIAVVAWNDSVLCQSATPSITAMSHEAHSVGLLAGRCLIQTAETGEHEVLHASDAFIVQRASS
jgi:DNA-binding LacI/PurR family transcriptional regulator